MSAAAHPVDSHPVVPVDDTVVSVDSHPVVTDTDFNRYLDHIRAIACESPDRNTNQPPPPALPDTALVTILRAIGNATPTRHGLDAALDALFAHPDIAPLLQTCNPDELSNQVLPHTHPRFAAHWTHIVRPAWEQHVALAQALAASAAGPTEPAS